MLVTYGGQLIRCPVDGIRIAGRSTQGVIVFTTAEGERVASGPTADRGRRGQRRRVMTARVSDDGIAPDDFPHNRRR